MQNGMAAMFAAALKNMGLDPDVFKANVENFMAMMKAQAEKIDQNQLRLERKLDTITTKLDEVLPIQSTREIYENGEATGVLITSERFPQALIDDVNGVTHGERTH